ncbi:GTP-binding protein Rho1 [Ceratobasidium sp. UAMH 11750]|nr:GTP-binding protein Rho1 [Ceratobasidium sp. UAMH 11750]
MNILRSIRKLVTRPRETKLPGIKSNKEENSLEVKVVFIGDRLTGKSNLVWACNHRAPWTDPGSPPPNLINDEDTHVHTPHGLARISNCDARDNIDDDRLRFFNYNNAGIIAFVFSIDIPGSLESIEERWKGEMDHFCPGIPQVVIGCKSDLRANSDPHLLVNTQSGIDLATRLGARHYIECSAQQYVNIERLLECIGSMAWEIYGHAKANRSAPTRFELSVTLPEKDLPQGSKVSKDA